MKIVMLSDFETLGGAAIAASRLANELCNRGHTVFRIIHLPDYEPHQWNTAVLAGQTYTFTTGVRKIIPFFWRTGLGNQLLSTRLFDLLDDLQPDIINVHNLHGAGWSPGLAGICGKKAPTVWTLHDMWSFTGRCAYSYDCFKFTTGCDSSCPTPHEYPSLDSRLIAGAWERRKGVLFANQSIVAVTPSQWLAREAQKGLWSKSRIEVIPNGLPLDIYFVVDRFQARKELGLSVEGPLLIAAADNFDDRRHGFNILEQALKLVQTKPLTVLMMGSGRPPDSISGISFKALGYIADERQKVLLFNAADLFVHPSPVGNLPNTVLESIACGTPVIGFDTGGLKELIEASRTGWISLELTGECYASLLETALKQITEGNTLRESCRTFAEANFPVQLQATRYENLFKQIAR